MNEYSLAKVQYLKKRLTVENFWGSQPSTLWCYSESSFVELTLLTIGQLCQYCQGRVLPLQFQEP